MLSVPSVIALLAYTTAEFINLSTHSLRKHLLSTQMQVTGIHDFNNIL